MSSSDKSSESPTAALSDGFNLSGIETGHEFGDLSDIETSALRVDPSGSILPPAPPIPQSSPTAGLPALFGEDAKQLQIGVTIGQGAMGVVSGAVQIALGREVAIKFLRPERATPEAAWELLREGRVLGALEHPNVVPVHMVGLDVRGNPAIVMKRISGTPWSEFVSDKTLRAPVHISDAFEWNLRVLIQVARAVHFAHTRGIVHRDIKPQNVMIGTDEEVYLVDWGLAVALREGVVRDVLTVNDIRGVAGTPAYMAPEMVRWSGSEIDARTDVFLLGGCLHVILTGSAPHVGSTVTQRLEHAREAPMPSFPDAIPKELADICTRSLSRDKVARFETARAFHRAIEEFLTHRHSSRIGAEAASRASLLYALLASPGNETNRIHSLFAESRFGFEQAIRAWEQNREAQEGLERLRVTTAEYWIDRKELEYARALMDELKSPSDTLRERFAALVAQRAQEAARVRALEQLHEDVDLRKHSGGRGRIMFWLGAFFGSVYVGLGVLARLNIFRAEHWTFFFITCGYGAVIASIWVGLRKMFGENTVGRRFMTALGFAFVGPFLFWPAAIYGHIAFPLSIALMELIYFIVAMMMAASTHRGLFFAGSLYALGFATTIVLPQYTYEILGLTTFVTLASGSRTWRTLEREQQKL